MSRRSLCTIFVMALAGTLLSGCISVASVPPVYIEIYYFYDEICGTCADETAFYELFNELVGDISELYPYRLIPLNVAKTDGRNRFEKAMSSFGHSISDAEFPLLMINSKLYRGEESIRNNLREAYLVAGEDIFVYHYVYNPTETSLPLSEHYNIDADCNTVFYFYRTECHECMEIAPFISALPSYVTLDGVDVPVEVVRLNTRSGNNGAIIRDFFTRYNVPDAEQSVPIVFLSNTYLSGAEFIKAELLNLLFQGAGLAFEID